ncbi:MAG: hypothetical protein R2761_23155 [Acidimicrobiales bacterium]
MSINDIDLVEINEAFASVVLAWRRRCNTCLEIINPSMGR